MLFLISLLSNDLSIDVNPSLPRSVESMVGAYHGPLFFLVGSLPSVENMHIGAQKGTEIQTQLTTKLTPKRPNRLKPVR